MEQRKNIGKMEVLVPKERNGSDVFGTQDSKKTFPKEWKKKLYFWRKENMSSEPRENFLYDARRTLTC